MLEKEYLWRRKRKQQMTKNIDERKYKLIREIMNLENESVLSRIESQLESIKEDKDLWNSIIKPMSESVSLDQMIKAQNYKPMDKATFFAMVDELEIEESIEELLSMLD